MNANVSGLVLISTDRRSRGRMTSERKQRETVTIRDKPRHVPGRTRDTRKPIIVTQARGAVPTDLRTSLTEATSPHCTSIVGTTCYRTTTYVNTTACAPPCARREAVRKSRNWIHGIQNPVCRASTQYAVPSTQYCLCGWHAPRQPRGTNLTQTNSLWCVQSMNRNVLPEHKLRKAPFIKHQCCTVARRCQKRSWCLLNFPIPPSLIKPHFAYSA